MKLKASRPSVEFDWDFLDGSKTTFTFKGLNTKQVEKIGSISGGSASEVMVLKKSLLKDNLSGDKKEIQKMLKELEEDGNVFELLDTLSEAVGKQKKKD